MVQAKLSAKQALMQGIEYNPNTQVYTFPDRHTLTAHMLAMSPYWLVEKIYKEHTEFHVTLVDSSGVVQAEFTLDRLPQPYYLLSSNDAFSSSRFALAAQENNHYLYEETS